MNRLLLTIGALAVALSLAVGLGSALAANHEAGGGVQVAVAGSGLGPVLVDGRGRTLYLFEKDMHGTSACAGKCATFWPPLIASGKLRATAGAKASLLGTVKRADGRLQVTYNHHPLYTFVKDTAKGQTNGEGIAAFGAEWYAVSAAGAKVEKSDAQTGGGDPMPGGGYGGYGY
ncbi:MAG: COG4315 family predicted lipoprotein [Gaiellaceae bacterium]